MDSLSQIALGVAVGLAIAPANQRRRAVLYGAALGTLPDLDSLIAFGGPVENFTYHRSFSHSLLVLPWLALLLHAIAGRFDPQLRLAVARWRAIFLFALISHPLLDWFTVYGTQLFWPLDPTPYGLGSMFIIDPLYTLPLVAAIVWALRAPRTQVRRIAAGGLMFSSLYLGWSALAQSLIETRAREQAAGAPMLALPTPFNTLLWRVLIRESGQYRVGYLSVLDRSDVLTPQRTLPSDDALAQALRSHWTYDRLSGFTHGFYALQRCDDKVVFSDLRMGVEPAYVFSFEIARLTDGEWSEIRPAGAVGERSGKDAGAVFAWMRARFAREPAAFATDPFDLISRTSCVMSQN